MCSHKSFHLRSTDRESEDLVVGEEAGVHVHGDGRTVVQFLRMVLRNQLENECEREAGIKSVILSAEILMTNEVRDFFQEDLPLRGSLPV